MATIIQNPSIEKIQSQVPQKIAIADSSFLQEMSYDPSTLQLTVTMKNGAQYVHWFFFPIHWELLLQQPSKGRFYANVIKGKHPTVKLTNKNVGKPFRNHAKQEIHARHAPHR